MKDVDLIPADYANYLRLKKHLGVLAAVFVLILALIGSGKFWITVRINSEQAASKNLKKNEVIYLTQKSRVDELNAQKNKLIERQKHFDSLQGGTAGAGRIFVLIDRAINDSVWLTGITYENIGESGSIPLSNRQNTTPGTLASSAKAQGFSISLDIRGQAYDFKGLADFIKKLNEQPGITDVTVQKTRMQHADDNQSVEFTLLLSLKEVFS